MKRNVDLTEYSDFNRRHSDDLRMSFNSISIGRGLFPWEPSNLRRVSSSDMVEEEIEDNWGIIQGDGVYRVARTFYNQWGRGKNCDCCGRELYPYHSDLFLCGKCNDRLNTEGVVSFETWR